MCVKREPHEASFAPFTPSSVGDSALADILPHQSSLSVDASTPSYPAHAHGPCYSQYASQPFIAGTTLPLRPHTQIKIQSSSLSSVDFFSHHLTLCLYDLVILKYKPSQSKLAFTLQSHQSHHALWLYCCVYRSDTDCPSLTATALSPLFYPAFLQLWPLARHLG